MEEKKQLAITEVWLLIMFSFNLVSICTEHLDLS
jgi:hypothetical protein